MPRWNKRLLVKKLPKREELLKQYAHFKSKKDREEVVDERIAQFKHDHRGRLRWRNEEGREKLRQAGRRLQMNYWGEGKYKETVRECRLRKHKEHVKKLPKHYKEQR